MVLGSNRGVRERVGVSVLLAKFHWNDHLRFFVGAGILLWMLALMGALQSGIMTPSRSDTAATTTLGESGDGLPDADTHAGLDGEDSVTELVIQSSRRRHHTRAVRTVPAALDPRSGLPTYPVWFESERNLGVCRIRWASGSKTANLHVETRLPEGPLVFWYQCGKHRGQGSIDIESRKVNGVLFCERDGGVKVQTVRSRKGRCGRR